MIDKDRGEPHLPGDADSKLSHLNDHDYCLLCGSRNPLSLKLDFEIDKEGQVSAVFQPSRYMQGYQGLVHGGVIAALLDAGMTHCLFHHGIQGLTCDLHIRYIHSIPWRSKIQIRANLTKEISRVIHVKAEILADEKIMVSSEGKFLLRK